MPSLATLVLSALCVALNLSACPHLAAHPSDPKILEKTTSENRTFRWDKLPALSYLKWQDCFPDRQCARLIVPLNHSDPNGREATIALIRIPAVTPEMSETYRGPILFNPGGPGGSGIGLITGPYADALRSIVGPDFDIVGFDPRGIGESRPRAEFFKTGVERALWGTGLDYIGDSGEVARVWARAKVTGQLALQQDDGYLRHMNTDQTARDMLKIVEAHGREKLQYWGFSYGTVLGATFAAMFPDKIERMILDGVADCDEYYGLKWSNYFEDTDKALESFFEGCSEVGPEACPFYAPSPSEIKQNLMALFESLRINPIPVQKGDTYGIMDYQALRKGIFTALYKPYRYFPIMAQGLAELAAGDGSRLLEVWHEPAFQCPCNSNGDVGRTFQKDALNTILCNDNAGIPSDLEWAKGYYDMMVNASHWADVEASLLIDCAGWPKFPKDNFRGPFVGNTSHPILFIGNTGDPVTPLSAAKKMSIGFDGSVVLTQNSVGHGSVSAPSLCTQKYVKEYFTQGTLPALGTICQPVVGPFGEAARAKIATQENFQAPFLDSVSMEAESLTAEEQEILDAVTELSKLGLP